MGGTTLPSNGEPIGSSTAALEKSSHWRLIFRVVRWTTYAGALITLLLVVHKVPPPTVEANPQAAARAEQKFAEVEKAVASGQAGTLHLDEAELNSYLTSHLDLTGSGTADAAPNGSTPSAQDVQEMRSNVRDVKVQLIEDHVRAYVLFDLYGKDMTLQLEGRLGAKNGYLRFEPISGQIGSLPIPQSSLQSAVRRLTDSPENRDKLKLPSEISDLRVENGEIVVVYR